MMANYAVYDPVKKKYVLTPEAQALQPQQSIAPRPTIRTGGFSSPKPQQQSLAPPPTGSINYRDPTTYPQPQQQGQSMAPQQPAVPKEPKLEVIPWKGMPTSGAGEQLNPDQSYISQTGQFQYDFWTKQGQMERLRNAAETSGLRTSATAFGGEYVPVASEAATAAIDALNVANLINAARGMFQAIGSMNKAGMVVLSPTGAKDMASTIPQAAGKDMEAYKAVKDVVKAAREGAVGAVHNLRGSTAFEQAVAKGAANSIKPVTEIAVNSKNFMTMVKQVGTVSKAFATPVKAVGGVALLLGAWVWRGQSSKITMDKDFSAFMGTWADNAQKFRDAGQPELADEIVECATDFSEALDSGTYDNIFTGLKGGTAALNVCKTMLAEDIDKLNQKEAADEKKAAEDKITADKAAADLKRQQDLQDVAAKQAYETQTAQTQREQKLQDVQSQRDYETKQQRDAAEAQAFSEDTATENVPGSTLTFGLLNSGGGVEFVDQDKAAMAYFKKPFEELTPAQKKLLMLSKGMIK